MLLPPAAFQRINTPPSDETPKFHDPINKDTQNNESEGDPVLNTFQQFLSQSWYQHICNTTQVYNLPGRAIHAHFARDSKYGHLISDNAADTGSTSWPVGLLQLTFPQAPI